MVYQLYVRGDTDWVLGQIRRAGDLGFHGFCVTVDTSTYSRRERDLVNDFRPASRIVVEGEVFQAGLDWNLVKRIRDSFDIPLILKGIATAEDARLAVDHGVNVVFVSNHGGRQLDHGRATIDMLPEIVDAVGGRAEIVVDGGFVRGADILKAIAYGADAVAIGKLLGWGLAAAGQPGVARVLEILESEIVGTMRLLGVTALDQLDATFLHPAAPVGPPSAISAFPLIDQTE